MTTGYVGCIVSGSMHRLSGVICRVSGIMCRVSKMDNVYSGVMCRVSGVMLSVWFLGSCVGCLGSCQMKAVWDHV